jgi:hypothetical protein
VREVADAATLHGDVQLTATRNGQPGTEAKQRRLPGSVRPRDDEEPIRPDVELHPSQDALVPVPPLHPASPNHSATLDPDLLSSAPTARP